jgi:hypothetical protein
MSDMNTGQLDGPNYFKEYAHEAGLEERDMPSANHPLMENDDTVKKLSDLIRVRENSSQDPLNAIELGADDPNLDIEEALTFPHKKRPTSAADRVEAISDFDADARSQTEPDDEDDESYMRLDDVAASMLESDPDPNAGARPGDYVGEMDLDRAADITGTVTGIARGMATHLPQDVGADGFQIEEPEALDTGLVVDARDQRQATTADLDADGMSDPDELENDGGIIPIRDPNVNARDEALDATRRIQ